MKVLRPLTRSVTFCLGSALLALGAHAGELEKIKASKSITIAHRDASIPFSYLDANKRPIGYAMDLCLKVAEAVKQELKLPALEIKYLAVTSSSRIPAIVEGKASLECGSTTNNAERRKQVDYTIPHFISSSRFLVRSDSRIEKLDDLAGRVVVSTKGTTNIKTLERLSTERALGLKIEEAKDHNESFEAVSSKKADAFAMDDALLFGLRANSPEPARFMVVGKPMTIEPYAIMLPKGDAAFKRVVDQELRRIMQSGEILPIYRKWFLSAIPPKGINLELPLSYMLKESFKFPSDKVGDLVD